MERFRRRLGRQVTPRSRQPTNGHEAPTGRRLKLSGAGISNRAKTHLYLQLDFGVPFFFGEHL